MTRLPWLLGSKLRLCSRNQSSAKSVACFDGARESRPNRNLKQSKAKLSFSHFLVLLFFCCAMRAVNNCQHCLVCLSALPAVAYTRTWYNIDNSPVCVAWPAQFRLVYLDAAPPPSQRTREKIENSHKLLRGLQELERSPRRPSALSGRINTRTQH